MDVWNLTLKFPAVLRGNSVACFFSGGTGREEGRQACYLSAAHSQQSKAVLDQKTWQPQIVLYVLHKWHTNTVYETDQFRAQDMGLTLLPTFSYVVVPFGDMPAECIASVVGHDQTILYERPLEVKPYAPAIHAAFCASGDRLLDPDPQQQKMFDIMRNCANSMLQAPHRKELEK